MKLSSFSIVFNTGRGSFFFRGLTLLEVVISALILGLIAVPIMTHFFSSSRIFSTIAGKYIALNASDEILQQLFIIPFSDLTSGTFEISNDKTEFTINSLATSTKIFFHSIPKNFTRRLSINKSGGLAEASIRISWSPKSTDTYESTVFIHAISWDIAPANAQASEK